MILMEVGVSASTKMADANHSYMGLPGAPPSTCLGGPSRRSRRSAISAPLFLFKSAMKAIKIVSESFLFAYYDKYEIKKINSSTYLSNNY